ncbi:serine/threonine protein phosphatase 1 [Loktanella fryxellensis]|uniref:Serine/threonine protein phosphatase 1 n=1 Tax=Loktanella fryxellensis TaxID=245187 RepID=A0A1H8J449_9RHOB|nr:metallophosphoesterase [Loktanella fryxellensis]SEN74977.1 serine/threonine protein phosphatase 1 [Loktanella fryxellensis]
MIYAIGDIHGQLAQLDRALALIAADGGGDAPVVFLGDYTDRGPDSRGVIDRLIVGRDAGRPWQFIKGNHDRMFQRFIESGDCHDVAIRSGLSWLNPRLGGDKTLASYGIVPDGPPVFDLDAQGREVLRDYPTTEGNLDLTALVDLARARVPDAHVRFLTDNPLTVTAPGHLFVHAGVRPGIALADQVEDDLIWIRDGWLDNTDDHGTMIVHGHTALAHPTHFGNRIDLDAGAGYGHPLVPAVCDDAGDWFILTDTGRQPIALAE